MVMLQLSPRLFLFLLYMFSIVFPLSTSAFQIKKGELVELSETSQLNSYSNFSEHYDVLEKKGDYILARYKDDNALMIMSLPSLVVEARFSIVGQFVSANITDSHVFVFYKDNFEIRDKELKLQETIPYPELTLRQSNNILEEISVTDDSGMVFIAFSNWDAYIWDKKTKSWDRKNELVSVTPEKDEVDDAFAIGSYWSKFISVVRKDDGEVSINKIGQSPYELSLSPQGNKVLYTKNSFWLKKTKTCLYDVDKSKTTCKTGYFKKVDWKNNRYLSFDTKNGIWSLFQIYPLEHLSDLPHDNKNLIFMEKEKLIVELDFDQKLMTVYDSTGFSILETIDIKEVVKTANWLDSSETVLYSKEASVLWFNVSDTVLIPYHISR